MFSKSIITLNIPGKGPQTVPFKHVLNVSEAFEEQTFGISQTDETRLYTKDISSLGIKILTNVGFLPIKKVHCVGSSEKFKMVIHSPSNDIWDSAYNNYLFIDRYSQYGRLWGSDRNIEWVRIDHGLPTIIEDKKDLRAVQFVNRKLRNIVLTDLCPYGDKDREPSFHLTLDHSNCGKPDNQLGYYVDDIIVRMVSDNFIKHGAYNIL